MYFDVAEILFDAEETVQPCFHTVGENKLIIADSSAADPWAPDSYKRFCPQLSQDILLAQAINFKRLTTSHRSS